MARLRSVFQKQIELFLCPERGASCNSSSAAIPTFVFRPRLPGAAAADSIEFRVCGKSQKSVAIAIVATKGGSRPRIEALALAVAVAVAVVGQHVDH